MPPNSPTLESPWQMRYKHDASEVWQIYNRLQGCRWEASLNTADGFAEEYIRLSKELAAMSEAMWEAAMAAWAGDLWPE